MDAFYDESHNSKSSEEVNIANTSTSVWMQVTVSAPGQSSQSGYQYLPKTREQFSYDDDGNLTSDGRWNYGWDAENRLVSLTNNTAVGPQQVIRFEYDARGRRVHKQVWGNSTGTGSPTNDVKFVYDGWNLLGELTSANVPVRTYLWGSDLSGSMQGAGGIGGLLEVVYYGSTTTNCFVAFDGNENVAALVNAADGTVAAQYEYGPFGEVLRATGPMAKASPFRFSTKYQDDETDLIYYGYRYEKDGRWISRDPIQEKGGLNLYGFAQNDPVNRFDISGLIAPHHDDPYSPSMAGKPCCGACARRPCIIKTAKLVDTGSEPGTFRIAAVDFGRSGCCPQWQLRWTSCIRAGHPNGGVIPECNDSTSCNFDPGYGPGMTSGSWIIGLYARYLSCENGVWTKHEDEMIGSINCRVEWTVGVWLGVGHYRWVCD